MTYSFDEEFATKYGVAEAIMFHNIAFWVKKNKANNTNFFDGSWWTYNSARAFKELFPFWSERQIRRVLKSLEEQGLIISGCYNSATYDRTKWYSIPSDQMCYIDVTKRSNGSDQKVTPIPYNKPDNINIMLDCKKSSDNAANKESKNRGLPNNEDTKQFLEIWDKWQTKFMKPDNRSGGNRQKAYANYLKVMKKYSIDDIKPYLNYLAKSKVAKQDLERVLRIDKIEQFMDDFGGAK